MWMYVCCVMCTLLCRAHRSALCLPVVAAYKNRQCSAEGSASSGWSIVCCVSVVVDEVSIILCCLVQHQQRQRRQRQQQRRQRQHHCLVLQLTASWQATAYSSSRTREHGSALTFCNRSSCSEHCKSISLCWAKAKTVFGMTALVTTSCSQPPGQHRPAYGLSLLMHLAALLPQEHRAEFTCLLPALCFVGGPRRCQARSGRTAGDHSMPDRRQHAHSVRAQPTARAQLDR